MHLAVQSPRADGKVVGSLAAVSVRIVVASADGREFFHCTGHIKVVTSFQQSSLGEGVLDEEESSIPSAADSL